MDSNNNFMYNTGTRNMQHSAQMNQQMYSGFMYAQPGTMYPSMPTGMVSPVLPNQQGYEHHVAQGLQNFAMESIQYNPNNVIKKKNQPVSELIIGKYPKTKKNKKNKDNELNNNIISPHVTDINNHTSTIRKVPAMPFDQWFAETHHQQQQQRQLMYNQQLMIDPILSYPCNMKSRKEKIPKEKKKIHKGVDAVKKQAQKLQIKNEIQKKLLNLPVLKNDEDIKKKFATIPLLKRSLSPQKESQRSRSVKIEDAQLELSMRNNGSPLRDRIQQVKQEHFSDLIPSYNYNQPTNHLYIPNIKSPKRIKSDSPRRRSTHLSPHKIKQWDYTQSSTTSVTLDHRIKSPVRNQFLSPDAAYRIKSPYRNQTHSPDGRQRSPRKSNLLLPPFQNHMMSVPPVFHSNDPSGITPRSHRSFDFTPSEQYGQITKPSFPPVQKPREKKVYWK